MSEENQKINALPQEVAEAYQELWESMFGDESKYDLSYYISSGVPSSIRDVHQNTIQRFMQGLIKLATKEKSESKCYDLTGKNGIGPLSLALILDRRFLQDKKVDLSYCKLAGEILRLEYSNPQKAHFYKADLQRAEFYRLNLADVNFCDANLQGAKFYYPHLQGAWFNGANLEGAKFYSAELQGAKFQSVNAKGAEFYSANLPSTDFDGAKLEGADLTGTNLEGARFRNANLTGAILERADLTGAILFNANLEGVNKMDIKGITLEQILQARSVPPVLLTQLAEQAAVKRHQELEQAAREREEKL